MKTIILTNDEVQRRKAMKTEKQVILEMAKILHETSKCDYCEENSAACDLKESCPTVEDIITKFSAIIS